MASGEGVSHVRALVSSEYTLKRCLDLHKVVPALLEQKSLPKSFRRKAKLSEKMKNLDVFLGAVRELNLDGFALFLETLDSLHDEKHNEVLQVLSTEIRLVSLPPEAQATKVIEKIVKAHYHETKHKDEPEVKPSFEVVHSTEEEQVYLSTSLPLPQDVETTKMIEQIGISDEPSTEDINPSEEQTAPPHVPPLSPLDPTVGNVELQTFTKVGGAFYSSTHGVRLHIPQESLPPTIQPFELKMTASLRGPYKFSEDCELCTAVIHLSCDPPVDEFRDWVTVEIPHCATEPQTECDLDHLCIMTATDELMSGVYEFCEDPEIEVDFSDAYKVVFKTRHFTRYVGTRLKGRKRKQRLVHGVQKAQHYYSKQRSLDSQYKPMWEKEEIQRSVSLPSSTVQYATQTGNQYYVAMCTPVDRSQLQWNVVFLVSYRHPTGLKEIKEAAERILGLWPDVEINSFEFEGYDLADRYVKLVPESYQEAGWKVESIKRPAVIAERDVLNYYLMPENIKKEMLHFSTHYLSYNVDGRNRLEELRIPFRVENARCYGNEVSFLLSSTVALSTASPSLSSEIRSNRALHMPPKGISEALAQGIFSTSYAWKLERLRKRNLDGSGTVIAILDTAVDLRCPAFLHKNIPVIDCLPHKAVVSNEHGNVCAAVAVGSSYNTPSGDVPSGVAPGAQLIVYRIAEDGYSYNEAVLTALNNIQVKIESGIQIDVVSISYDLTEDNKEEIRWKIKGLTEKGVVFVAAAGNRGRYQARASIPACFDSVISVGALDKDGFPSRFNARGRIDVYAPGENIPMPSTTQGTFLGTSFATPAVGGLVLLLKQCTNRAAPPASNYIHQVEILRDVFQRHMITKSDDGQVDVFDPVEFFLCVIDNPNLLHEIVQEHLDFQDMEQ